MLAYSRSPMVKDGGNMKMSVIGGEFLILLRVVILVILFLDFQFITSGTLCLASHH